MSDDTLVEQKAPIIPQPGKETGVWHALDALYFQDDIPLADITHDLILEKRKLLEGKAGDRSGLKGMIARWCRKNNINYFDDPKKYQAKKPKQVIDPIQKITANLYQDIEQTVRAEIETEMTQLETAYAGLVERYEEMDKAYHHLKGDNFKLFNDYQLLQDEKRQSQKAQVSAEAKQQSAEKILQDYQNTTEQTFSLTIKDINRSQNQMQSVLERTTDSITENFNATSKSYHEELNNHKTAYVEHTHVTMEKIDQLQQKIKVATANASQHEEAAKHLLTENRALKQNNATLHQQLVEQAEKQNHLLKEIFSEQQHIIKHHEARDEVVNESISNISMIITSNHHAIEKKIENITNRLQELITDHARKEK